MGINSNLILILNLILNPLQIYLFQTIELDRQRWAWLLRQFFESMSLSMRVSIENLYRDLLLQ